MIRNYLSLIKFSHTIFALPFALLGFTLAALSYGVDGFDKKLFLLMVGCMIFARSAAMGFNRYLDRDIDAANPRTVTREIPAGIINPKNARFFVIINCIAFVMSAYLINWLCFVLSPVALAVVLGYSYTKRFTSLCHFVLGLGLGLAPIGAYLAAGGKFDLIPLLYSFGVLCWVAGFDIIYALQDEQFDRAQKLHSIPAALGTERALRLSRVLHVVSATLVTVAAYQLSLQFETAGWLHWVGLGVYMSLLVFQHRLVKPNDLSRVNMAFFTTNGIASVLFAGLVILDLLT